MQTIGERIRTRRKEIKATQAELAMLMGNGTKRESISQWETDAHQPSGEQMLRLSRALNVSPDWLITGRSDTTPLSLPATSSSSPKLLRLIRSLESLEQSAGLPPELVDALQKTVDAFSKRSLDDDKPEIR